MAVQNSLSIQPFNFHLNFNFLKMNSVRSHFNFESLTVESIKRTLTIEKMKSKVVQTFRYLYSKMLIHFIYFILLIWSSVELVTSLIYLTKNMNKAGEIQCPNCHLDNFLNHFCERPGNCLEYLKYGLIYRAAAAAFLLSGTIFVSVFTYMKNVLIPK